MVLHLEVGHCSSGINCDGVHFMADMIVSDCRQWPIFLDREKEFSYGCPTCGERFRFISGVLQHAESARCEEDPDHIFGPLAIYLRHLRSCVSQLRHALEDGRLF